MGAEDQLGLALRQAVASFGRAREHARLELTVGERGQIAAIGNGVARVSGLPGVGSEELVRLNGNRLGLALDLRPETVGVVLLDPEQGLHAGSEVQRTGRVLDVPVGPGLLGRVVDPLGRPLDGQGTPRTQRRLPTEQPTPGIIERAPVNRPLQTGIKVIDALIPVGRGQRELILGDRQTGKSAVAIDSILNQRETEVACIYCAIGQRSSQVAKTVAQLRDHAALDYTTIVMTTEDDPPGLRYIAPYAAMSMAEHFRDEGGDALVVFDDLTCHARAYREISLLLRRPPGREAFPGDIFFVHSRLLERATQLSEDRGGGSVTALPIVETEAQNISAYIPTNIISITDGQIYLSPDLFQKGVLPAIDVGRSVSRVGGEAQLPAYRAVAGDLRLSYSQFHELESFARFGTQLDQETRQALRRGRRVREVLKQPQLEPLSIPHQIAVLMAVNEGLLDDLPQERIADAEQRIREQMDEKMRGLGEQMTQGEPLEKKAQRRLRKQLEQALSTLTEEPQQKDKQEENREESDGDA